MNDKKVLLVASEVSPYLCGDEVAIGDMVFDNARIIHKQGIQTRMFMPRFGVINERRHQLHEVIRLSGINIIINDLDLPLTVKVGSIPKERIQVYFIDNEEYFSRKAVFTDDDDKMFDDNDERAIFFIKGVIETVKRLNWRPDIIHVHGWFGAFLPIYLKTFFKEDLLFTDCKIITSVYPDMFEGVLSENLSAKLAFDNLPKEIVEKFNKPTHEVLMEQAIINSDAVVDACHNMPEDLLTHIEESGKPLLEVECEDSFARDCLDFYKEHFLE